MIGKMLEELIGARGAAKIAVLKRYRHSDEIRWILKYTYNTEYVYHVRPAPVSPMNVYSRTEPLSLDEVMLLSNLHDRSLSGHAAKEAVEQVAKKYGPLIKLILARDLQCGVAAISINKAMPGLIPQFKVQLAKEVPLEKVIFPCIAQLKYDGVRLVVTIKGGIVKFRTRNGKQVKLRRFAAILERWAEGMSIDIMLDAELIVRGGKMADRTSVSGMVNSAMHGGFINESILELAVFDYMRLETFEQAKCGTIYSTRYKYAKAVVEEIGSPMITIAENMHVSSAKEVELLVADLYAKGHEGLILKSATHKYSFKRSKDWVKIKEIKTADLLVVDYEEGTGKYEGMIGALCCTGKVEGKAVTVNVGSGLNDTERGYWPKDFIGKIVEVKYNSLIRDSRTGRYSLFLPRFSHIRYDR